LTWIPALDRQFYPSFDSGWDDEWFRKRILARLQPIHTVLDYGAGRGNVSQMNFRGLAGRVSGTDVDPSVARNPFLDDHTVFDPAAGKLPYPDATFDVAFSDNVFEHLDRPEQAMREIYRVLKPGGRLLIKTPNWWHYMPLIAAGTPHWFHVWYNAKCGRAPEDTFPTRYRANTESRIWRLASETGFEVETIEFWEGRPEYLRFSLPTYFIGLLYERLVNSTERLRGVRSVLFAEIRKA